MSEGKPKLSVVPEPPKTLWHMVAALDDLDALLEQGIDPEQLAGDLKVKVEGLYRFITMLRMDAARLSSLAERREREADRLEDYVFRAMLKESLEEIPGHTVAAQIKTNGKPPVVPTREATAQDLLERPEYVRVVPPVPQRYEWDKNAIYKLLKAEGPQEFAQLGKPKQKLEWKSKLKELKP